MTLWQPARGVVMSYVAPERIESISGAAAQGAPHLDSARAALVSAHRELELNPEAAYTLGYDAARKAAVAILAQQGLRARGQGHHATTQESVRAQCGGAFENLGTMRKRRNEIEYPLVPGGGPDAAEVAEALEWTAQMITHAEQVMDDLPIFDLGG